MQGYYGRTVIYSPVTEITRENVKDVLDEAVGTHNSNVTQIDFLYNYYRGNQPIYQREKEIRPEINNTIVENRAWEIVNFKVGYLVGSPIQYISRTNDVSVPENVQMLNSFMWELGKESSDKELVEWQMICGTSYKLVRQREEFEDGEPPFEVIVPDPRNCFVIYSADVDHRPLAGVYFSEDEEGNTVYRVCTKDMFFTVIDENITVESYPFGVIPLVEYPGNNARMGAFEIVIDLLDQINTLNSNRIDSVEQFVQSLLVLYNADIDDSLTANAIRQAGMILLKSVGDAKADVKVLSETLDQAQTQTLKDDAYNAVLTICSMPNRNSGNGDNGVAVIYRDGWSAAETDAQAREALYKKSEQQMLKAVLRICTDMLGGFDLTVRDIAIKFTRRSYENIETKSQVFAGLMNTGYVDILDAYTACDLFPDPEKAAANGKAWHDGQTTSEVQTNTATESETVTDEVITDDEEGTESTTTVLTEV